MKARLPEISMIPDADRLKIQRKKFEELYNCDHPLKIALEKLQTMGIVRIIEGKP